MPGRMARHVQHLEPQPERFHPAALRQGNERSRNALACRAVHRGTGGLAQGIHAAYMIGVVVRD